MTAETFSLFRGIRLSRLAGPLLDKELRMASRRRRHYILRAGYAAVLILLVFVTWGPAVAHGSATLRISRMPEVAKTVTTTVVWFQFVAAQAFAIVMLSSAVSEETRKGTLGVLLTTPITSLQIVVGKLFSRMLQVLLLLAMSLPMLALLRLLGGVPLDYVLAGVCVTLSATLMVGSASLWLSTCTRRSHKVVSAAVLLYAVALVALPLFRLWWPMSWPLRGTALFLVNAIDPVGVLYNATIRLWSPGVGPARAAWPTNCLTMLGLTVVLLALAVRRTRRAAVAGLTDKAASVPAKYVLEHLFRRARRGGPAAAGIKRVTGSPIVWKETRQGLVYGWSLSDIAVCVLALLTAAVCLVVTTPQRRGPVVPLWFLISWILSLLVFFRLVVDCAGSVPRERDARTWPILLATPLEGTEIVYGKARAVLLHNAPLMATVGLLDLLTLAASPNMAPISGFSVVSQATSVLLIVGLGSYFGVLVKTRAGAVAATIGVFLGVKYIATIMLVISAASGPAGPVGWILISSVIYLVVALVAIMGATCRVRHAVF
jgi:ABC-type transport system involved in multi-copper enzyme maturation permease subunit